jgi:hypothetical protein
MVFAPLRDARLLRALVRIVIHPDEAWAIDEPRNAGAGE